MRLEDFKDRVLRIKFSDNSIYYVDVTRIIEHRARAYALDFDTYTESLDNTLDIVSEDEEEISEWACNMMSWWELEAEMIVAPDPPPTASYLWDNGDSVDDIRLKIVKGHGAADEAEQE